MPKATVPINALKAVALFAGRRDIRYYLNGVLVTSFRGNATLAATDGHRVTVFRDTESAYKGPDFIVPIDMIDDLRPPKGVETADLFIGKAKQVVMVAGGVTTVGQAVDGKFPDWQRVVPRMAPDEPFAPSGFNAEYLAAYAKMHRLLGSRFASLTLLTRGGSSALVDIGDKRFICVIMPMRCDEARLPEWFTAPLKTPKKVKSLPVTEAAAA